MAVTRRYGLVDGRVKVQIEDLLGTNPTGGWVYQAPGVGNKNAEGAHYYYRSQTAEGSLKTVPTEGRFTFNLDIEEAGTYSILLRASRDTNTPGDARNDIWIRVDDDTQAAMPAGTPTLTSGGDGFVKLKGAQTHWVNAHQFSTHASGDKNPESTVVFHEGVHSITFAPRSTGYHIDSVQVIQLSTFQPEPAPEIRTVAIAAGSDDFESLKAAPSQVLELGHIGGAAQSVGLRFGGIGLDGDVDIKAAYFVFEAAATSSGTARLAIEVQDATRPNTYSAFKGPDGRTYLDDEVSWTVTAWEKGKEYKSADISGLIEAVIADNGIETLDALAFRLTGTGQRDAVAFEGAGAPPELVIEYA
ncbi:MAG TPA: hypothetical protein VFN28_02045 [Amaricoccus sp.]|nr:hypothetical protein [Amaricoccus sp.]